MLTRIVEWYRVVDLHPGSTTIKNRETAVREIIKAVDESKNWDLALSCAAGVVAGFDVACSQESAIVATLVAAIRNHEPSIPSDLSQNAVELRVCAALALGEILVRDGATEPSNDAAMVAAVLRSGFGIRPVAAGEHLKQMLDELLAAAAKTLSKKAAAMRAPKPEFTGLPDGVEAPESLRLLGDALRSAQKQSRLDREEINVLWWMFAAESRQSGQPLSEMPVGPAVLCAGVELAEQCLVPAMPNQEALVRRAVETARKPKDVATVGLRDLVARWTEPLPSMLVPDANAKALSQEHPVLFPLSWLCQRLGASHGSNSWAQEIAQVVHIPVVTERSAADWAVQVFRERQAHRFHHQVTEH